MFTITVTRSLANAIVLKETHTNFEAAQGALYTWAEEHGKNVWTDSEVGVYGLYSAKTGGFTHKARITW